MRCKDDINWCAVNGFKISIALSPCKIARFLCVLYRPSWITISWDLVHAKTVLGAGPMHVRIVHEKEQTCTLLIMTCYNRKNLELVLR